jgi:hypothetical protein
MSISRFNAVVILDAIPEGESNTARRLKEELDDVANYIRPGLQISYIRIKTISDLHNAFSNLLQKIQVTGLQPLMHFEGHGLDDESGFALTDESAKTKHYSWKIMKELIAPLNVASGLNLLLVMATCYGGSFATAINITDRAPLWGLIGPTQAVKAGQLEISFQTFYKTYFNTLSASESLKALNETAKATYFITTAEQFFYAVWKGYKINYCSEGMIEHRANQMFETASRNIPNPPSVEKLKRMLSDTNKEKILFDKYRDQFFGRVEKRRPMQ